jgi:hypothetical protein
MQVVTFPVLYHPVAEGTHAVQLAEGTHAVQLAEGTHAVQLAEGTHAVHLAEGTHAVQLAEGTHAVQLAEGTHAVQSHVCIPALSFISCSLSPYLSPFSCILSSINWNSGRGYLS